MQQIAQANFGLILAVLVVVVILVQLIFFFSRYKKCPSDKILVISGKTGRGQSAKCMHGGAVFVWPVIQAFEYMDLTPIKLNIKEQKFSQSDGVTIKLSPQCTVAISTEPSVMSNAAERLLGASLESINDLAQDIIQSSISHVMERTEPVSDQSGKISTIEAIEARAAEELKEIGLRVISMDLRIRLIES